MCGGRHATGNDSDLRPPCRGQRHRKPFTAHRRTVPALIEVYPHVALLALLNRNYRVPYKVSRSNQYWKTEQLSRGERIQRLLREFQAIKAGLDAQITGIPSFIPMPAEVTTLASLKPVEDMLDGVICARMGIEYLEGLSTGVGDATAAIWVPKAYCPQPTGPEAGTCPCC